LLLLLWSPCPLRCWHPCFCNVFEPQIQVRRSQPTRKAHSRFLFSPQKRNGRAVRARHKKNLARPIYLRFSQQTDQRTSIWTVSPLSVLACNKYFIEKKERKQKYRAEVKRLTRERKRRCWCGRWLQAVPCTSSFMVAGAEAVIAGIAGSFAFLVFRPPPLTALCKPRLFSILTMVTFPLIFTIEKWPNFVCIYYYSLFFLFFSSFSRQKTLCPAFGSSSLGFGGIVGPVFFFNFVMLLRWQSSIS